MPNFTTLLHLISKKKNNISCLYIFSEFEYRNHYFISHEKYDIYVSPLCRKTFENTKGIIRGVRMWNYIYIYMYAFETGVVIGIDYLSLIVVLPISGMPCTVNRFSASREQ